MSMMIDKFVSLDLMEFIERNILPRYNQFDKAHGLTHVTRVIKSSLELAHKTGADIDMVYAIAAYHDLGLEGPRAIHHLTSGKILIADIRLRKWFSPEKLRIMREAVEDHRASASHAPRSIYGKIIAEADRDLEPEMVFRRAIEYGIDHYPEKKDEEQWERFVHHMEEKYAEHGYIRLWIQNSPNEQKLKQIRKIISSKDELRRYFDQIYQEEKQSQKKP